MGIFTSNIIEGGIYLDGKDFNPYALLFGNDGLIYGLDSNFDYALIPSPTSNKYTGVTFTNSDTGYAVTNLGEIIKTNDAGRSWSNISSVQNIAGANGITNTDLNTLFVCGQVLSGSVGYPAIFKSVNKGINWSCVYSATNTTESMLDFSFVDQYTGFCVSNYRILMTTDGGNNWTLKTSYVGLIPSPGGIYVNFYPTSIDMYDAFSGVVGIKYFGGSAPASYGLSAYTGAEGAIKNDLGSGTDIFDIKLINKNLGFACGGLPKYIGKTSNGSSWSFQSYLGFESFKSISFISGGTKGITAGNSGVAYYTNNSGATWAQITGLPNVYFNIAYRIK